MWQTPVWPVAVGWPSRGGAVAVIWPSRVGQSFCDLANSGVISGCGLAQVPTDVGWPSWGPGSVSWQTRAWPVAVGWPCRVGPAAVSWPSWGGPAAVGWQTWG